MKKKITFLLMFVLSLSISSAQNTFRFGTSATPEGKTLLVDSKGLILDGKHIIPSWARFTIPACRSRNGAVKSVK
jgi:hypothetical protein